jgi:predicted ATPase
MFTEASRALADAAADRGLLVILEDLQWADRTSLLLLRHLAGELARTRLLVVGTFRDTADSPLDGVLPDLLRTESTRAIRLAGLSRPDIAQVASGRAVGGELLPRLRQRLRHRPGARPVPGERQG